MASMKEKLIGLPVCEKIGRFIDLDKTANEFVTMTGVKEICFRKLMKDRGVPYNERHFSLEFKNAEKICKAFDAMVKRGEIDGVKPNTPSGLPLSEKVKLVLNMDAKTSEIAFIVDVPYVNIAKLRSGESAMENTRLKTLLPFEKAFKNLIYSNAIQLDQEDITMVVHSQPTTQNTVVQDTNRAIRNYRFGNYLAIDESDIDTQKLIINTLKENLSKVDGSSKVEIRLTDNKINENYMIDFLFIVNVVESDNGLSFSLSVAYKKTPKIN